MILQRNLPKGACNLNIEEETDTEEAAWIKIVGQILLPTSDHA